MVSANKQLIANAWPELEASAKKKAMRASISRPVWAGDSHSQGSQYQPAGKYNSLHRGDYQRHNQLHHDQDVR